MLSELKNCKERRTTGVMNGALILAFAGFVSKFLGALYRIPLTNILGAEGIGLYQLVFPIYSLVLVLSSGAIPTATAVLVAEMGAMNDFNRGRSIFKVAMILLLVSGLVFASALFFLSEPISKLQGNIDIRAGYLAVAPAVLVVAVASAFKGWFQGNLNMAPSALSQIVEQVVKMAAGLLLAWFLMPKGVMYAVTGALIGLTLSEVVAFFTMAFIFIRDSRKAARIRQRLEFKHFAADILKLSAPIFLSSLIFPISNFTDSILIVNVLKWGGDGGFSATAEYGIFTGPVGSLINMPVIIALAVAITIVPVISRGRVHLDACGIKQKSSVALKTSYAVGIPCTVLFVVLARPLMSVLYGNFTPAELDLAVNLLRFSAINVVLLSQVQIYSSLLQALGKSKLPIIALFAGVVLKITLNLILIPRIGIYGAAVSTSACFFVSAVISGVYFKYLLGKNAGTFSGIFKILAASAIMGAAAMLAEQFIPNKIASLIIALTVSAAVYGVSVLIAKVYSEKELSSLPFGKKLAGLQKKFG